LFNKTETWGQIPRLSLENVRNARVLVARQAYTLPEGSVNGWYRSPLSPLGLPPGLQNPSIGIGERGLRTICTSHEDRLNGAQRVFLKRLNRLTYLLPEKVAEPGGGVWLVRSVVQLLLADAEGGQERPEATDCRYDGGNRAARLEL
jgi:hypothetical protein